MNKNRLPRLCVTSPWNYPLFNPDCQTHFGGWEVRIALVARELARRGNFRVSLVVGDHGQPHVEHRDAVTLYSWVGRTIWGIPAPNPPATRASRRAGWHTRLREKLGAAASAVTRRRAGPAPLSGSVGPYAIAPEMISVYDEVDAEIHVVPGNSQFSAEAAFYCRRRGKKYVFLSGSDFDYFPEYRLYPDRVDMYSVPHALKSYSIESADLHIVQNERQAQLLREGYGRDSVIVMSPIDLERRFPRSPAPASILWVGKSDERIKRPSMVLDLARRLPQYPFVIIMTFSMKETHDACIQAASRLPNVTLLERVPFEKIESYFAAARLHLNTSVFEGFPNTFLQSAKYGVPTVSMQVDPGGMLAQQGCGRVCAGDPSALLENTRAVMTDDLLCAELGRRSVAYLRANHDKDIIIPRYEEALTSVWVRPSRSRVPSALTRTE